MSPRTPAAKTVPPKRALPREREHFLPLLASGHFDKQLAKKLTAKAAASASAVGGNTTYEELHCIGYQPQFKRLEAVVHVKQQNGFNGGICSQGSKEYVRFWVSTNGGATWTDKGTAAFTAYDVPGAKPLEYAVSLDCDLEQDCCKDENLVLVRGILSWNVVPAGPNAPVVWGNALDATISVDPLKSGPLPKLLHCLDIDLPLKTVAELAPLEQQIQFGPGKQLSPLELEKEYAKAKVPQHRYLLPHLHDLLKEPAALSQTLSQPGFQLFAGLQKVDIGPIVAAYSDPQGNETYEQLTCVGLDPVRNELDATIHVKKPTGYSGNLCTAGSYEYVAFWVDWQDGAGWNYAGTTSVNVHDIHSIPAGGLDYAVFLPFPELNAHRQPCKEGPKTARIRAVLSWGVPPSTTDPHKVPYWGGHEETLILIEPGTPVTGNAPYLETIGGMAISTIDVITGLASGVSVTAGFVASNSPFGGRINFTGHIANPSDFVGGGAGQMKYKIWLSQDDGATWTWMTAPFTIYTTDLVGGVWGPQVARAQTPDVNGFYSYWEDLTGPSMRFVASNFLGYWDSGGNGSVLVYMESQDSVGNFLGATAVQRVKLDNTAPVDAITITSGGGPCGDFHVGDVIHGTYSATDNERWNAVGFGVEPPSGGSFSWTPGGPLFPSGQFGTWQLDTTGMTTCGYVIRMDASDWTIVNSSWIGWDTPAFAGFCLKA